MLKIRIFVKHVLSCLHEPKKYCFFMKCTNAQRLSIHANFFWQLQFFLTTTIFFWVEGAYASRSRIEFSIIVVIIFCLLMEKDLFSKLTGTTYWQLRLCCSRLQAKKYSVIPTSTVVLINTRAKFCGLKMYCSEQKCNSWGQEPHDRKGHLRPRTRSLRARIGQDPGASESHGQGLVEELPLSADACMPDVREQE
jgi:hypothetical protein